MDNQASAAYSVSVTTPELARKRHESWEKRFGETVRNWRNERGWPQEEVARRLGWQGFDLHQTTIAKIERGARPLRIAEAAALAEVFEMPITAIFGLTLPQDRTANLDAQQRELEQVRRQVDDSRETLYSVAQRHAYLLAELEKLFLQMNQDIAGKVADVPEA
ncbi:helix-turn-helix domain-containing protein [Mycolicibacterium komossense]|uniref:Helix-turn-helix transcriptional regulator n=1 Tax=Mycolicibacterium komossense TaxID=1779 RepID=A0ABT3C502_9MYCO|nr:helix-turn-helix transcriptional regulator [Mycolicibacterium komossense]MCV7224539.1 helix-turn-helix transcriptional regulator [Mycolicibacterium komossense]